MIRAYRQGINDTLNLSSGIKKQCEQKEIDYDEELKKCKDNPLYFFDKYVKIKFEKQGEQKPVEWSEEDIEIIKMIEDCLSFYKATHCATLPSVETCIDWLKSLKPNHWKPSEEQMKALNIINTVGEISYVGQGNLLIELYNELKKL